MPEPRIRIALASILGSLGISLVTLATAEWLEVWGVQIPVEAGIFLALGFFIVALAITAVVVPTRWLKVIWGSVADTLVCRVSSWILWRQRTSRDSFLHLCNGELIFLPMSGGKNYPEWTCQFEIVNCLPRHLRIDAIRLHILTSDYKSVNCEYYIRKNVIIKSLNKTNIPSTSVRLSGDAFRELAKVVQGQPCPREFSFRLRIQGDRLNKPMFVIESTCSGQICAWGPNNC